MLFSKLMYHVEDAFEKARSLRYVVGKVYIFLKTQRFTYRATEVSLQQKTNLPLLIREELMKGFDRIYEDGVSYRATGCTISDLQDAQVVQQGLFNFEPAKEERVKKLYDLIDQDLVGIANGKVDFGSKLFDKNRMIKKKPERKMQIPFYEI